MNLTQDSAAKQPHNERAVLIRVAFVLVLSAMLLVALHWALNVTNANARQVSTNLSQMQNGFDRPPSDAPQGRSGADSNGTSPRESSKTVSGPTLEPVENGR